jgi:hypothetical protein
MTFEINLVLFLTGILFFITLACLLLIGARDAKKCSICMSCEQPQSNNCNGGRKYGG